MYPTSGKVGNRNAKGSLAGRGAYKHPAALSAEYLRKRARAAAGTSASSRVKPKRVKKLKLKTFKFRRYFLSGLDLSWARKAALFASVGRPMDGGRVDEEAGSRQRWNVVRHLPQQGAELLPPAECLANTS